MNKIVMIFIALFIAQAHAKLKQGSEGVGGGNVSKKMLIEEILTLEEKIIEEFTLNYAVLPEEVQIKFDLIKKYTGNRELLDVSYESLFVDGEPAEALTCLSSKKSVYDFYKWKLLVPCNKAMLVIHENFVRIKLEKSFDYTFTDQIMDIINICTGENALTYNSGNSSKISSCISVSNTLSQLIDSYIEEFKACYNLEQKNQTASEEYSLHLYMARSIEKTYEDARSLCVKVCKGTSVCNGPRPSKACREDSGV